MKWLHDLLKGVSLTGALFAFQACYGIPEPPLYSETGEAPMTFSLVSRETGEPITGVSVKGNFYNGNPTHEMGVTGQDGRCKVNIPYRRNDVDGPCIRFEDPEGRYESKDTTLADLRERDILVKLSSK